MTLITNLGTVHCMMIRYFLLVMSIVVWSCAGPSVKEKKEGIPFVGDREVNRYILENGLKILIVEDHSSPTFAYQTWFDVGSKDEKPHQTGLAHLFEHMMFNKTKNLEKGEFDLKLEAAGVQGKNAFTSQDITAYIQQLPSSKLELIIQLEAERLDNLVVDQEAFDNEIRVVLNEIGYRYENNPNAKLFNKLFQTAFTRHPYRHPIGGYPKDLKKMTPKDALDFYSRHYGPNSATITIVGDVDSHQAVSLIKKYYGKISRKDLASRESIEEPTQKQVRRRTMKLNLETEKLILSYPIPDIFSDDLAALEVIQGLLTDGMASRLNLSLIETGIASGVYSGNYGLGGPSVFVIIATLQKNKRSTLAENIIYRELRRLKKEKVSDRQLERTKNVLDFNFYTNLSSDYAIARFLGDFETRYGGFEKGLEFRRKIQQITPEDIQRVAQKYFASNQRTIVRGIPK